MIAWLSPANVEANHKAATMAKQEGTGSWFLENPVFTEWLDKGDRGLMWLHAIPGAGKTVLASSIINHLTAAHKSSDVGIVYFYCDYKEPEQQCPTRILATLLAMLSTQSKAAFVETQAYFQKQYKDNPAYQVNYDELRTVFPIVARHFRRVLVVIDALDESISDRQCFINTLLEFSDPDSGCIKALVTSRNVYDIADAFRELPTVCIGKNDIAADIESYITAQIKGRIKDRKLKLRDPSLENEIISVLQQKAEGM
ncbi:hypothetical protein K440DRAFT_541500 [Wilcoxina mikolae CBS 423.85]|nr:hypothetical protein K440DRAFT_541500 [Wilcoxina mikolae CBS 423.85]